MSNGLGLMNRPTDAVYIYNLKRGFRHTLMNGVTAGLFGTVHSGEYLCAEVFQSILEARTVYRELVMGCHFSEVRRTICESIGGKWHILVRFVDFSMLRMHALHVDWSQESVGPVIDKGGWSQCIRAIRVPETPCGFMKLGCCRVLSAHLIHNL